MGLVCGVLVFFFILFVNHGMNVEQADNIAQVTQNITFSDFLGNVMYSASVIPFFVVIGEAAKYVSGDVREEYPDIPWR